MRRMHKRRHAAAHLCVCITANAEAGTLNLRLLELTCVGSPPQSDLNRFAREVQPERHGRLLRLRQRRFMAMMRAGYGVAIAIAVAIGGVRVQGLGHAAFQEHAHAAELLVAGLQQLVDRLGRSTRGGMLRR